MKGQRDHDHRHEKVPDGTVANNDERQLNPKGSLTFARDDDERTEEVVQLVRDGEDVQGNEPWPGERQPNLGNVPERTASVDLGGVQ